MESERMFDDPSATGELLKLARTLARFDSLSNAERHL